MDEFNKIRKEVICKGRSRNEVAKQYNRSWETVDRICSMLEEDIITRGKRPVREGRVITSDVLSQIKFHLEEELRLGVRRKQRWIARTLFNKLTSDGIYGGSERRFQEVFKTIKTEVGSSAVKSYLPLDFNFGEAVQFDHGEADVVVAGVRYGIYLFAASVPGTTLRLAQAYPTKSSEAWGAFHNTATEFFGGVFPKSFYDNDSVLVKEILGNERAETEFSLALQEHFGFESCFCNAASGWEKGSVENAVGYLRRNFLSGLPEFESFTSLNTFLLCSSQKDSEEKSPGKISELSTILIPAPDERRWEKIVSHRVSSYQLITHDGHDYSVPERFVGSRLEVGISVSSLRISCDGEVVALHPRCYGTDQHQLDLDHYLEQLRRKPAGFNHCKAVKSHEFSELAIDLWSRLNNKHDSRTANRKFVEALLLRRGTTTNEWETAIGLAISYGAVEPDAIENILSQMLTSTPQGTTDWLEKELPHISGMELNFNVAQYDDLLNCNIEVQYAH